MNVGGAHDDSAAHPGRRKGKQVRKTNFLTYNQINQSDLFVAVRVRGRQTAQRPLLLVNLLIVLLVRGVIKALAGAAPFSYSTSQLVELYTVERGIHEDLMSSTSV